MVYYIRWSDLGLWLQYFDYFLFFSFFLTVNISSPSKKELAVFLKKVSSQEPSLSVVDADLPLNMLCKNDEKLEQVALGREFHISLGRTVPIRVHQIDSMVSMLRQKLQTQPQSVFVLVLFNYEKWNSIYVFIILTHCCLLTFLVLKQLLDWL